jgi:predicted Rossmann fold nucleotide-binding protein DprA/Smf involved in DNA uptake
LFGSGNLRSLQDGGLAVVGPRHAPSSDLEYAAEIGEQCASEGISVISGGARGVDQYAMNGAISNGGNAVGVLGDSLEKLATSPEVSCQIQSGNLLLISPYHPKAHFQVGQAMGRNKIVYALADWALVVSCEVGRGGTWNGAITALRHIKVPVFVRADEQISDGNRELLKRSAQEFAPRPWTDLTDSLNALTKAYQFKHNSIPNQPGLFDNPTS